MNQTEIRVQIPGEEILLAEFAHRNGNEMILYTKSKNLYLYYIDNEEAILVFGGLTFTKHELKIYSFENFICIVEHKGIHGLVLNLEDSKFQIPLKREEYQVEHCSFPIAFYKKGEEKFLIHGTDWNRLDITHLDTGELLTDRTVDYEKKANYIDYFHSSLLVSPNYKHFISNGWYWSPVDSITVYSIEQFLEVYELSFQNVYIGQTSGYNWDRPVCWVDNQTLAIAYNKMEDEELNEKFKTELLFFDIQQKKIVNKMPFDVFTINEYGETKGILYFDKQGDKIIGMGADKGVLIKNIYGEDILDAKELKGFKYSENNHFLYSFDLSNGMLRKQFI